MRSWLGLAATLAVRGIRHPSVGAALIRVGWRFRTRGWYARFPFLPLPAPDYLRWRMYTAYGDGNTVPPAEDVIRYALWAVRNH
jgi:hypothetical protein